MDPAERQESLVRMFGTVNAFHEDDGLFVLSPDRIGFGVIAEPIPGNDQQFDEAMNAVLNLHYPTGTIVQAIMYASPDIEDVVHQYRVMRHGLENPLLKEITNKRVEFLRELTQRPIGQVSGAKLRQTQVLITVQVKVGVDEPSREQLGEITELRSTFLSSLKGANVRGTPLTPDRYIRFMESVLNHGREAVWRRSPWASYDDKTLICNQLLDSDNAINVDAKQIHLGDHAKVRVLSVKRYPEYVYTGMSMRYLADLMKGSKALRDPLLVTVNILYPDHESQRGTLNRDFAWTTRQTEGSLSRYIPSGRAGATRSKSRSML
jgi:conjugal transfer ATP-binding protein TraC